MQTFSCIATFLYLIVFTSAIPDVTPILIGANDCSAYPNSYFHAGDNADAFIFSPDQVENSSINSLPTSIYGNTLFVFDPSSGDATNPITSTIFCCDHGGTILDAYEVQTLLLSNSSTDTDGEELAYLQQGRRPETYAHELSNGTRLDGVFLGSQNVTTWGLSKVDASDSIDMPRYKVRLLVKETTLLQLEGEVKGFLKVLPPTSH